VADSNVTTKVLSSLTSIPKSSALASPALNFAPFLM